MKKGKRWRKKTWIPPVVCVLEQVNSLYSRIAITSTLQQGCSWLELNAAWLNQTRGLFFSLFVKMQIWPASHCKNSDCLQTTFPIFVFPQKIAPLESDNNRKICSEYVYQYSCSFDTLQTFLVLAGFHFVLKQLYWTSGLNKGKIYSSQSLVKSIWNTQQQKKELMIHSELLW